LAPKYIAFFVFIFIAGTILGLVIEDSSVGSSQQSTLNSLLIWQEMDTEETWGVMETIGFARAYFPALFKAFIWDFAFFTGQWIYLKWIIWAPLMAMAIWGIILTFLSIFQRVLS